MLALLILGLLNSIMKIPLVSQTLDSFIISNLENKLQKHNSRSELPLSFLMTDHRSLSSVSLSGDSRTDSRRSSATHSQFSQVDIKNSSSITPAANRVASPKIIVPKEIISGCYYGAQDKAVIKTNVKKPQKKATEPWVPRNDIFSLSASY